MDNIVLTDPTYNSRRIQGQVNSENDFFRPKDMKYIVQEMKCVMTPGEHGHIFRSTLKFNYWYRYLDVVKDDDDDDGNDVDKKKDVDDDRDYDDGEDSSPNEKSFSVEHEPIGFYYEDPVYMDLGK